MTDPTTPTPPPGAAESSPSPKRMSVSGATVLGIGSMVGAGIFALQPLGDLAGVWNEVPEATYAVVWEGQDELRPFAPRPA